ncbi:MAG: serine O-acetyltransferase EpsC [Planctomycetota bacterium]|jgi:serine O-acetyltransferase
MFRHLWEDIRIVFDRDPSIRGFSGYLEIIFTYPGFHALFWHRIIHWLFSKVKLPFFPRLLMEIVRRTTGIEIHPGVTIGRRCVIDHGMGVVMGETTVIGDDVTIFQGVTLGGTGHAKGKRHPTIGNFVTLGANCSVLGKITVGDHVRVGAGSVVIGDVPDHSTVIGVPGVIVRFDPTESLEPLSHEELPDPVRVRIHSLLRELVCLGGEIGKLEQCKLRDQITDGKPHDAERCEKECAICDMTRAFISGVGNIDELKGLKDDEAGK